MIDEIAVERVRLFCPEGHWQREVDVDVVRYADPDGGLWEYFSIDGDPVMSPYTPDGRPLCPVCGRTTAARLLRRRWSRCPTAAGCAAGGRTAPSGPTRRCFRPIPSRTGPDRQAKAGPRSVCPGERPKRVL